MNLKKPAAQVESNASELLQSNARKVIYTVGALYLIWHMLATLAWPETYSPSLWVISGVMLATLFMTLRLLPRVYWLAQVVWFLGLTLVVLLAYGFYQDTRSLLLLALLPMMAVVMTGLRGTVLLEALLFLLVVNLWRIPFLLMLPKNYETLLIISMLATGALGWGLADNLMSATDASLYHYREALKRLEEARQHRAEISVLLKEQGQTNYQLERLNKMLEFARARAEEAREARDRFALSVSHELRSPLNFVIGFSDLMVNSPETYAPLEQWPRGLYEDIQQVYHSSSHLLSLINDILDMGRMDARQMVLFKEKADMREIIEQVVEMTNSACQQKGLQLLTDLPPDLPTLYVDRTRIRQVLLNMVANAMRFTSQGSITIRAALQNADRLEVQVVDTGAGISPEDLGKLFEEFRQVGGATNWRRREGSGLGLAIGRRFIELHGGEMSARSEMGKGSTFWFTLPLQTPIEELDEANPALLDQVLEQRRQKQAAEKNTLLLFLSTQRFWARVFAETLAGYQVTLLEDPSQLAAVTTHLYPRALLIDRSLADAPEVQAFLQALPYDLPVIELAVPVDINHTTALPEGVRRYLVKPVPRQVLIEAVSELGPQVKRILVVDDDPGMVRFLSQALRSSEGGPEQLPDYEIITALDGAEALNCIRTGSVDAILLDLELPDMNGLTLLDQVRAELPVTPPVIIISANDLPQRMAGQESGMLDVRILRPFNRRELGEAVAALVDKIPPGYQNPQ